MKKTIALLVSLMLVISIGIVMAAKPTSFDSNGVEKGWEKSSCISIQDGVLKYTSPDPNEVIPLGYDRWGYNYQAHMFRVCIGIIKDQTHHIPKTQHLVKLG